MTESMEKCYCIRCNETAIEKGLCQKHKKKYISIKLYDEFIEQLIEKERRIKELTQFEEKLNTEQLLKFLGYFTDETQPSKFEVFKNQEMMKWSMKEMMDVPMKERVA